MVNFLIMIIEKTHTEKENIVNIIATLNNKSLIPLIIMPSGTYINFFFFDKSG